MFKRLLDFKKKDIKTLIISTLSTWISHKFAKKWTYKKTCYCYLILEPFIEFQLSMESMQMDGSRLPFKNPNCKWIQQLEKGQNIVYRLTFFVSALYTRPFFSLLLFVLRYFLLETVTFLTLPWVFRCLFWKT